jgi:hypothetical protein
VVTLLGLGEEPATLDGYGAIDIETARRLVGEAPMTGATWWVTPTALELPLEAAALVTTP